MRVAVKKRILFLSIALITYTLGFQFLPQEWQYQENIAHIFPLALASVAYFVLLPILYWFYIIKANQQKPWKLILIFSLSCLCARYSFPSSIALYFDFIAWVRYPIIGILLIIEFYLMFTIIKGLWGARNLSGDPRLHVIEKYQGDDKKLTLALPLAWEPTSWYYALPKFSRQHAAAITNLSLVSANWLFWFGLMIGSAVFAGASYYLLIDWSELAAIIVSSLVIYGVIFLTANYRVARYYSIYLTENKLVINNAFFGLMSVDLVEIEAINIVKWKSSDDSEQLSLGKGKRGNVELKFKQQQTYFGMMGQFPTQVDKIILQVDEPQKLIDALSPQENLSLAS